MKLSYCVTVSKIKIKIELGNRRSLKYRLEHSVYRNMKGWFCGFMFRENNLRILNV